MPAAGREADGREREDLLSGDDTISARQVLEAAPDALVIVDDEGRILQANAPIEQLFGYARTELLGRPVELLVPWRYREAHAGHRADYFRDLRRRPMGVGPELFGLKKDGTEFPVEISLSPLETRGGRVVIAAIRDISVRKRAEAERSHLIRERALYAEISRLARQDALTGLPNRVVLLDRLGLAIAAARRYEQQLAVLFIDVDRFKQVNDSLGHGVGDRLLQSVARRLTACVRGSDTVSRQGGDEFVILLPDVQGAEDALASARKIIAAVSGQHHVGHHELHITLSIGISVYPGHGEDAETLIRNADTAMYHAKEHGRDDYVLYTPEMSVRVVERQAIVGSLRRALERQEFVLYYQPKINLETGMMIGAEALIRWHHPERGLMLPTGFVPIAEESGLIVPIGQWVLGEACRQARRWQEAGLRPVPLAVNISALEFRSKNFLDGVRGILEETKLRPHYLELEVTESALMQDVEGTADMLRELKGMGVQVAVDDFGTGYSSLSYLRHLPIDALKVDRSFVQEIATDHPEASPIITAVISLGKSLKHRVIAEGVETTVQLSFLQSQHCGEGQGYHFSRPLTAGDFGTLLSSGTRES